MTFIFLLSFVMAGVMGDVGVSAPVLLALKAMGYGAFLCSPADLCRRRLGSTVSLPVPSLKDLGCFCGDRDVTKCDVWAKCVTNTTSEISVM